MNSNSGGSTMIGGRSAMSVITLINRPLLTCLLTHGAVLALLILYLLPKNES